MPVDRILATAALWLHLFWLLWVICGWLLTPRRPLLRWLHIGSLLYGIVITVGPWPCPLTLAEQHFQARAGQAGYEESFLEHYLDRLVYPNVPTTWLTWGGVGVCSGILLLYLWRYRHRDERGW
ncbi:MAG: DUF2784 domain-containing protein [Firmicutes bacterium]|nr:DUF2784 domain-containing protein [Bacillota bacterium]